MKLKTLLSHTCGIEYIRIIDTKNDFRVFQGCNCDFKNCCPHYNLYINRNIDFINSEIIPLADKTNTSLIIIYI